MSFRSAMRLWTRVFRCRLTTLRANVPATALEKAIERSLRSIYRRKCPDKSSSRIHLRDGSSQWNEVSTRRSTGVGINYECFSGNTVEYSKQLHINDEIIRFNEKCEKIKNSFDLKKEKYNEQMQKNSLRIINTLSSKQIQFSEEKQLKRAIVQQALENNVREYFMKRRDILRKTMQLRKEGIHEKEQQLRERGRCLIQDLRNTKALMREKIEQVIEKENIYTIPNLLCVTRIAFSPYLGYLIMAENFHYALAFMTVAGISDWLDGWIARNYANQSTKFGSFLDPLADKVLIGTLFVSLTCVNLIPVWLTCLILGRDLLLVISGFVIRYRSLTPPRTLTRYFDASHVTAQLAPTMISKVNTGIQLAFVASTLAAPVFDYVGHPVLQGLCYITTASTVIAAISYITSKNTFRYISRK